VFVVGGDYMIGLLKSAREQRKNIEKMVSPDNKEALMLLKCVDVYERMLLAANIGIKDLSDIAKQATAVIENISKQNSYLCEKLGIDAGDALVANVVDKFNDDVYQIVSRWNDVRGEEFDAQADLCSDE
jgi:hypothetical protein